jgi:hypothetical protein
VRKTSCESKVDHQAFTPFRPPTQQYPKQAIKATEARATSSAALQDRNLLAQRNFCLEIDVENVTRGGRSSEPAAQF